MEKELGAVPTIAHLAAYASIRFGARVAIEDGNEQLTFNDLEQAAQEVAKALLAHGIVHGDRVALWAPNSGRWIIAALGLQMAGGVLVPLNTRLKGREAADILRRSGARILLTVKDFLGIDYPVLLRDESLPQLEHTVLVSGDRGSWSSFIASGRVISTDDIHKRLDAAKGDDFSDLIFTSGTTGISKGVLTTHGQNLTMYRAYSRNLGLRDTDRFLMVNPFFHTFGYKAGWLSALMRGATMLPHAVFDAAGVLERIGRDRVTVLPGPPALYQSILAQGMLHQFDLRSLRLAITGASSISVDLIRRMRTDLGFKTVLTAYGLTETCGVVSMCSETDDVDTIASTSGRALEGVEIRVVDEASRDVAANVPGEILVRGPNVMKQYFQDPEETARVIDAEGWLRTGDIGVLNESGYVQITDRKKDMFIVGGFNCYPAEIENILITHPLIEQVAVIGVPDQRLGEVAEAYIVLRSGAQLVPEDVINWSRQNMANYKVPRFVEIVEGLPRNASGKVQRFMLRAAMRTGVKTPVQ
jgi:HIP---CoA ligase